MEEMKGPATRPDQKNAETLLRIYVLGPLSIEWGQHAGPFPKERLSGRGAAPALGLLKALIAQPHRFALRDWLMEQFWPTSLSSRAEERLDDVASGLRSLLRPPGSQAKLLHYVYGTRGSGNGYRLDDYPLIWVDADALSWYVEQAARYERFGHDALPLWEHAYQLAARGEFLPEEPYSDWATARREIVAGHARQCLHRVTTLLREAGATEQAVLRLRTYWQAHPTDEDALRPLLELLGEQERYQEAEDYYQQLLLALDQMESGRRPDQRTTDLREFLRGKQLQRKRSPILQPASEAPIFSSAIPVTSQQSIRDILVLTTLSTHDLPLTEPMVEDCGTWFSERLTHIIAFIMQRQRQMRVIDFEKMLERELRVFDEIKTMFDPDIYFLSRRNALLVIAALPKGLLSLIQQQKTIFIEEEFLPACAASITACWHLLNGREFVSVERALGRYLPFLVGWARQPSIYQKTAAYLASQAYLLLGLIELHRLQFQQRIFSCKEAVDYARDAEDCLLLIKALTMLGNALYDREQYADMLRVYQQAKYFLDKAQIPIPSILQSKVLMGLAHAYAQHGKAAEALNTMSEAHIVFPDEIEDMPVFLSADEGIFSLILFDGWVLLDLGRQEPKQQHYTDAAQALARIETLPPTLLVPERIRIEITNRRAQAAIGLGNLDAYCHYTLQNTGGLKSISSEKRRQELVTNYKAALKRWPHEPKIVELADVIL